VRTRLLTLLASTLLASSCGGGQPAAPSDRLLIVVNAPFSRSAFLGETIANGAELAVRQINEAGGVDIGGRRVGLRLERMDSALSPETALENVRAAVEEGAALILDEGTGVDASWAVAGEAMLPICIVYQGGIGLVNPEQRPNVFRIAPTDRGVGFRLAEYLIPKGLRVAFLHDDTAYGQQGAEVFAEAWASNPEAVAAEVTVPSGAEDVAPQVLEARRSGADALLVWARPEAIAKVIRAARSAGWDAPVYTPPAGEDPLVRQELSDHPEWVDGLTFAGGRMTAEKGPDPFLSFKRAYEDAFGPDLAGVRTSSGDEVVQPPDYPMYPYDCVNVFAAAVAAARSTDPARILDFMRQVDVQGANGDERGFNELSHEGVVDDDVYFAVFHDMTYAPVDDDPLSSTLPEIEQTR